MFRSMTTIRELVLSLAKVMFIKLYLFVLSALQNAQHTTHISLCDMLPHHHIIYNDVILLSVLI
jgi:hypothetical protein